MHEIIVRLSAALVAAWPNIGGCGARRQDMSVNPGNVRAIAVGRGPGDVAIGDIDRDGRMDLVTADHGDNQLSVLIQGEDGRFSALAAVALAVAPHLVALADLDRDGDLDVVATAHDDAGAFVFVGDGAGRFTAAPGSPFAAHGGSHAHNHGLVVADVDGDGAPDVLTANQDGNSVSVLLGDGNARFTPAPGSPVRVGRSPYPLTVVDIDRDLDLDLVVPLVAGDAVAVLLGDGRGRFSAAPGSPHPTADRPYAVVTSDIDGDGAPDVVVSHDDSSKISILLGDGTGRLSDASGSPVDAGRRVARMAAGDIDGDGSIDVVAGAGDRVVLLRGDGRGGLTPADRPLLSDLSDSWSARVADIDGDHLPDVVVANTSGNEVRIRLANVRSR